MPIDGPFVLGEWTVFPARNRLVGPDRVERVEPKVIDVLLVLARRAGQVVDRETLVDEAWGKAFLAESAVSRVIAALRRALGDDAHEPRYLETISKRGYRLMVAVRPVPDTAIAGAEPTRRRWWVAALLLAIAVVVVTLVAIAAVPAAGIPAVPAQSPPGAAGTAG